MSARKTFEDYYYEKIYDKVEERKNDLVRRWRAGEKLPLIKVSGQKNTEDEWLEALNVRCTANGEITDIVEFSNEPIYVVLRTQKGKKVFCEAVCVEYFRLHELADKGTAFRRYTYFEMYYDDKVIACLMGLPFFERRGNMDILEMNEQDWMNSKRQMREIWKVFLPETVEMETEKIPENFQRRIEFYKTWKKKKDFARAYPDTKKEGLVWPLAAYLVSLQMLPMLPQSMMPWYLVNYVCRDDDAAKDVVERLQRWLADFLQEDPIVNEKIGYGSALQQADISNPCAVIPYIQTDTMRVQRKTAELMQENTDRNGDWRHFPFGTRVPVLVSTDEIVSSAVLNITVDSPQDLPDRAEQLREGFRYGLRNWLREFPKEEQEREKRMRQGKKALGRAARNAREVLEADKQSHGWSFRHKKLFQLSANLLTLYGRKKDTEDLPIAGIEWAMQQGKFWIEKEHRIEDAAETLLSELREKCQTAPEMKKSDTSIPEDGGRKTVNNEELLVFEYSRFKKRIEARWKTTSYNDLRERLCEIGVMICSGGKGYYAIKAGGTTINAAAFPVKKLIKE